jgi:hypothetical protein
MSIDSLYYPCLAGVVIILVVAAVAAFSRSRKKADVYRSYTREDPVAHQTANVQQKSAKPDMKVHPQPVATNLFGPVFISYRRSDSADIAGRIYDRLKEHFGQENIFKDVDSIPLGVDFKEYLGRKVSECRVLLAVIGDSWVDARDSSGKKRLEDPGDFVRIEIESALERGIRVIPLMVRNARMPAENELPVTLRKLVYKNGIPIRPDPDFHRDMDRLISSLEKQNL